MSTRYIPHIIYSIAITSITTHLLNQRKEFEDTRYRIQTHIALLESTVQRLRAGEDVPEIEFERIEKLKSEERLDRGVARGVKVEGGETIGWREVLLGRKGSEVSEWEKKDLENG